MPKADRAGAANCRGRVLCDDRQRLPVRADFTPFRSSLGLLQCSPRRQGRTSLLRHLRWVLCPKCSGGLTRARTSWMSVSCLERCPQGFVPAPGIGLGDTSEKNESPKASPPHPSMWLCLGRDVHPPRSSFQARLLEGGVSVEANVVQFLAQT